jgi:hypothetical protein
MRQLAEKKTAKESAKKEKEAVVRAKLEAEEKRVAAEKKAEREAKAAEQRRLSQEGARVRAKRDARELSAAPPTPDSAEVVQQRKQASAQKKDAEKAEKTRKWQED